MAGIVWALSVFVFVGTITRVSCITNGEFLELILQYPSDIEEADNASDAFDESDDVIHLPGDMDDELDVAYIFEKLGVLADNDVDDAVDVFPLGSAAYPWLPSNVEQQHPGLRLQQALGLHFGCSCRKYDCDCCARHTFVFRLIFKTYRKHVSVCAGLQLLHNLQTVEFSFKLNGRRLFYHRISLRNPPMLCFPIPGTLARIKVCVGLYDINLRTKHVCVAVYGVLDLWLKKFKLRFKLGCFRIPILDKDAFLLLTRNPDFFRVFRLEDQKAHDYTSQQSRDFMGYLQEEVD